jgi:4-nitrophenyl phosphatase
VNNLNNHMTIKILTGISGLILDMDGVLWRDRTPIGNLSAIFTEIKRRKLKVVLATNNATLRAEQYVQKLAGFGVQVSQEQIVNSAQAVANYLLERHPRGGPVYVVGEQGVVEELAAHGFHQSEEQPVAVVVGLDRKITYEKLLKACLLIRAGTPFIGTNPDKTLPVPAGLAPGAGAFVAAVQAATDQTPVMIGKPGPELYLQALKRMGLPAQDVLVVGDRLETDIAGAQRLGCRTGLVLSGVTTAEQAAAWRPELDYIADDLSSLLDL